ncbi:MAG: hypothetical protein JSS66_15690 [Armatimonadetes bacterium]|nr:hypothetical protein [Armatimonadota bacterium]
MKKLLLLAPLALFAIGCQPESGSAEYSKEVSKEVPKPRDDMPVQSTPGGIILGGDKSGGAAKTGDGK